jgi:microcin C transport system substrate-binding protein
MFFNERPRPTFGLWINTAQPLLDNQDVRLGISYATNWDLVIEQFFRGDSSRLNGESDGYGEFTDPGITARPFDLEQAQKYFAAAGFKQRGPDGILVNDAGQRLSFTLTSGYESLKDILTILKQEAAKAGLEFRIEMLDSTASFKKALEKKHEIYFGAFAPFLEMYPRFWEYYHSDNAYDDAFLADGSVNPDRKIKPQTNNIESFAVFEMDQMIDRYRASSNRAEMVDLSHRMQQLHYDQASFVPGFYQGFFRLAYWRWVHFPEGFSYRHADNADELYLQWIDTAEREATLAARKEGRRFEPSITVYGEAAE